MFLLAVFAIAGLGIYVMTPEERRRAVRVVASQGSTVRRIVRTNLEACAPWLDALAARGGQPLVAFAIALTYLLAFAALVAGAAGRGEADTLIGLGASFGPRTTNGEWWRLLTAMFLHRGILSLAVDLIVIVQLGVVLERLFGRVAFATVFLASGLLANTIQLAAHPVAVTTGASGALYGLYGLLIVWALQGLRSPSELAIPAPGYRLLGPIGCLFVFTSMMSGSGSLIPDLAALTVGVVSGFALASAVQEGAPSPVRMGVIAGSTAITIAMMAVPSIGTADVRPEITRVLGLEARTAEPYAKAVGQFKLGATSSEALAQLIDARILPQLRDAKARLDRLHGVPPEHRAVLADAERYVQLRTDSWELRARALHSSSMRALRLADQKERDSLDALERVRAADLR